MGVIEKFKSEVAKLEDPEMKRYNLLSGNIWLLWKILLFNKIKNLFTYSKKLISYITK